MAVNTTVGLQESSTADSVQLKIIVQCIRLVISLPVLFGNALVIVATWRFRPLRKMIHALIMALAVADFNVGLYSVVCATYKIFHYLDFTGTSSFCGVCHIFSMLTIAGSINSTLAITTERYVKVVHGINYYTREKKPRAIIGLVTIGLCTALFPITDAIVLNQKTLFKTNGCSVAKEMYSSSYCYAGYAILSLLLVTIFYFWMLLVVIRQRNKVATEVVAFNCLTLQKKRAERRFVLLLLSI